MSTYYEELCLAARRLGADHDGPRDDHDRQARRFLRSLRETWAKGRIDWAEYLRLIELTSPSSPSTAEMPICRPETAAAAAHR